jgi:hypothetical protein
LRLLLLLLLLLLFLLLFSSYDISFCFSNFVSSVSVLPLSHPSLSSLFLSPACVIVVLLFPFFFGLVLVLFLSFSLTRSFLS